MSAGLTVPLFPLPNVVHFPQTDLRLHVFESRYRRLVADLLGRPDEERLIGMVLLKTSGEGGRGQPPVYSAGTVGRLVDVAPLEDGRSNIRLRGLFRFEIDHEIPSHPYRQATVREIVEPQVNETDPEVMAVRSELLAISKGLAAELGTGFSAPHLDDPQLELLLEPVTNALAAQLDLPAERKLELLADPLPERALKVLGILRSRQRVLDLLRPFRHLAASAELN